MKKIGWLPNNYQAETIQNEKRTSRNLYKSFREVLFQAVDKVFLRV